VYLDVAMVLSPKSLCLLMWLRVEGGASEEVRVRLFCEDCGDASRRRPARPRGPPPTHAVRCSTSLAALLPRPPILSQCTMGIKSMRERCRWGCTGGGRAVAVDAVRRSPRPCSSLARPLRRRPSTSRCGGGSDIHSWRSSTKCAPSKQSEPRLPLRAPGGCNRNRRTLKTLAWELDMLHTRVALIDALEDCRVRHCGGSAATAGVAWDPPRAVAVASTPCTRTRTRSDGDGGCLKCRGVTPSLPPPAAPARAPSWRATAAPRTPAPRPPAAPGSAWRGTPDRGWTRAAARRRRRLKRRTTTT
jgi:hypothetical protein